MIGCMDLLRQHVEHFNQGVRTHDFSAMLGQFADDAEMVFVGIPVGPFAGRAEIAAAYAEQPPDDTIVLLESSADDVSAQAAYAWGRQPGELAGRMDLEFDGSSIRRLTITYLR